MDKCICHNNFYKYEDTCAVCDKEYIVIVGDKEKIKNDFCKVHRIIKICGSPFYVCEKCKQEGWINIHGHGGPPENRNKITGEQYKLIYDEKKEGYRRPNK